MRDSAKSLFFEHLGSKFGMSHNGVLDEYEYYGISEAQEAEWRKELIAHLVSRLSPYDVTAAVRLCAMYADEALPDVLRFADKGDSYARLIYANVLWDIATFAGASASRRVVKQACETAVRLWHELVQGPVVVDARRQLQLSGEVSDEAHLRNLANRRLIDAGRHR
jgi:inosine-uridine nucleoside N-ribohydrolase